MKVLFIGGSGVISAACSALAVQSGIDLYLLNRGESTRAVPESAKVLRASIRDKDSVKNALADHRFDAVVDWIAFASRIFAHWRSFRPPQKRLHFIKYDGELYEAEEVDKLMLPLS